MTKENSKSPADELFAPLVSLSPSNLYLNLTQNAGDEWPQKVTCKDLGIEETVITKVPRLLPEATIKAIHRRLKRNTTYHGTPKYQYLLTGFVYCNQCGHRLSGQPIKRGKRLYYRHSNKKTHQDCPVRPKILARADELEAAVIERLFLTFGNSAAVQRAIEAATPNLAKRDEAAERAQLLESLIANVQVARNRILDLIEKEAITQSQAKERLDRLNNKEATHQAELAALQKTMARLPTAESIKAAADKAVEQFRTWRGVTLPKSKMRRLQDEVFHARHDFEAMSFEDKRELVKIAFAGYRADGKPNGVYVEAKKGQRERTRKRWRFYLYGELIDGDWGVTTFYESSPAGIRSPSGPPAAGC